LLLLDIEHLAGPGGGDAFRFERELNADPPPLDRVAPFQLRGLDRFGTFDLEPFRVLVRTDALSRDRFLLRNARCLDGFPGSNVGLLDCAVAGDLERADALLLRNARSLGGFSCGDACDIYRLRTLDLELAGALLGADAFGRQRALARDSGRLH